MDTALTSNQIPDDVTELKSLVVSLFSTIGHKDDEIESYKNIIHVEFFKKFFFFYNYILNFFFKRINLHIFIPTTDVFFTLFWPLFF